MGKLLVIQPGGYHPFHAGHYALYESAKKAFSESELYIAATDDQSERPFPFRLKEKLAKLAGVEPGRFVQVKNPFQSKEITENYDPESDVLLFVRSEKDRNENPTPGLTKKDGTPAYFQPYTGKDLQPFSKHAYIAYLPTVAFGPGITSATQIRKAWPTLNDKRKTALVMSLYPKAQQNPKLAQNVVQMFDQVMGGQEGVAEGLEDSNAQTAIIDTVERLFHKNQIGDYSSLEAIRQGVKHHFSKPGASVESAIDGILNILDKRMRKNGNYADLGRFKEALRQGIMHRLKKQGLAEEVVNESQDYLDEK